MPQPGVGPFEIKTRNVEFMEVNKTDGVIGIWGPFCGGMYDDPDILEAYAPFRVCTSWWSEERHPRHLLQR